MDEQVMIWIADYCAGTLSEEDFEQLGKWLESAPQHEKELRQCLRAHRAALELTLVDHLDNRVSWQRLLNSLSRARRRKRLARAITAAACIAGICLSTWIVVELRRASGDHPVTALPGSLKATLSLPGGESISLERHVTLALAGEKFAPREGTVPLLLDTNKAGKEHLLSVPRGGEYHLTLADGTLVWLNSDTRLRFLFPFTGTLREVHLEGEAYFEVHRDADRPFIVRTRVGEVSVLGTAFNISAYPENREMVTTLVAGSVEMAVAGSRARLAPSAQATWRAGWEAIEVKTVEASRYTSWIGGVFEFEDTSLREILAYLSRWYDVSFSFAGDEIAALRFTGGARKYRPLEEFLESIERSCEVTFSMKGSVIHVSGSR
ncbi:MAG: DUF4974 domain-containing protein [Odoribacteraceae bacterium]|jgi:ferric-dicitrate binding protein FerR (iron transport regulator)|nr:DUF4974 domain-containing protein [Odoribacteraceae bacterium]